MARYNHMFSIAFSLETENEGHFVSADEIMAGLKKRMEDLSKSLHQEFPEILEAVGEPSDTYELEMPIKTELAIKAFDEGGVREGFRLVNEAIAQDKIDGYHRTPLQWACEYGVAVAVEKLLDTVVDVNEVNKHGKTALHYAAREGNPQIVEMLLDAGARVAVADNLKNTPLHLACQGGHTEAAIKLIGAGAQVSLKNSNGETPTELEFADGVRQWLATQEAASIIENSMQDTAKQNSKKTRNPSLGI